MKKRITLTEDQDRLLNSILETSRVVCQGRKGVTAFMSLDAAINVNCEIIREGPAPCPTLWQRIFGRQKGQKP